MHAWRVSFSARDCEEFDFPGPGVRSMGDDDARCVSVHRGDAPTRQRREIKGESEHASPIDFFPLFHLLLFCQLHPKLAAHSLACFVRVFVLRLLLRYPGHMAAAKAALASRLSQAHLVIEVRDARIPFSSGNPELESLLRAKKKIIVLNKSDLGDTRVYGRVRRHFEARGQRIMWMTSDPAVKRINPRTVTGPRSKEAVTGVNRSQMRALHQLIAETLGPRRFSSVPPVILVVGLPNTGKSTLINQFRLYGKIALGTNAAKPADDKTKEETDRMAKGGVAATGAEPGVTRGISGFLVSSPVPSAAKSTEVRVTDKLFLLDTPGIMLPYIPSDARGLELGLRLGAIAALKDLIIGPEILARYMLWALNRAGEYTYVNMLGLPGPTADLERILEAVYLKRYAGTTVSNSRLFYEFQRRAARQKREAEREALEREGAEAERRSEGAEANGQSPEREGAEVERTVVPVVAPLRVPLDDPHSPAAPASAAASFASSAVRPLSNLSSEESLLCTNWFIKAFRRGEFGRMVLDEMPRDVRPPQDPSQQTHNKIAVRNQRRGPSATASATATLTESTSTP